MSDDSSCLEQELERLLFLEDESLLAVSTPRQRLEDARAMADGVVLDCDGSLDCDDGSLGDHLSEDEEEEGVANDVVDGVCRDAETKEDDQEETSTHLLQRLSRDMADSGEWRRFHDINHESQGALAEMNVALGSLQQWRKQRRVEPAHCGLQRPPGAALEPLPVPQPSAQPQTVETNASPEEGSMKARDVDNPVSSSAEEEDPLLTLWQGHHLRAQEAAERLQKQLSNFVPRPPDDKFSVISTENDLPETTTTTTTTKTTTTTHKTTLHDLAQEKKVHTFAPKKTAFQGLIAQEKARVSSEEEVFVVNNNNNNSSSNSDENRVLNLRREVESLEMNQLIENARVQASGHAVEFAREACDDDIWRGTQRSVGEMEGELAGFTEDLDSLLLRLGSGFDGREGIAGEGEEEEEEEGDGAVDSGEDDERAPAADMHIDR